MTSTIRYPVLLAGCVSFLFFALEAILLLALDTTTTYFQAQMIIATSLFGVLIGTIVASVVPKARRITCVHYVLYALWLLPLVSLGLALLSYSYPLLSSIGLIGVFAPLGFVVSVLYWYASPWQLYASELVGAVCGLGYFVFTVPHLRSENALLALALITLLFVIGFQWHQLLRPHLVLLGSVVAVIATGFVSNIFNHHVNLILHTVCTEERVTDYAENKVACLDESGVPYQLDISLGSLQNRIDIFKTATDGYYFTAYSGTRNDVIQPFPAAAYDQDARIPAGIVSEPKTLILGAGAEGVVKVVKAIGGTDITVVEHNPAVLKIWNENLPYAKRAHNPFANTDIVVGEARLFTEFTTESYDLITLMNTHRTLHAAQFGYPDFLHTKEAFLSYFETLSPKGFLSIEEPSYKNEGDADIARRIATIVQALTEYGVENPYNHIVAYQWVGVDKDAIIKTEYDLVYTQLIVKREPWTSEQLLVFRDWAAYSQQTDQFQRLGNMTFFRPIWYPDTGVAEEMTSSDIAKAFSAEGTTLKILTDTAPFSTTMSPQDKNVSLIFFIISGVGAGIFLLWYWRSGTDITFVWLGYFFLIGLGYMMVEMFLLLWLQLYLGSIFITMLVVITGLFAAGALTSMYYRRYECSLHTLTVHGVLLVLLLCTIQLLPWPDANYVGRLLVSSGIAISVGVLLAPFFPHVMRFSEVAARKYTPILVGVNGLALAVAVPLSIFIVTLFDFWMLVITACAMYVVALGILYIVRV